MQVDTYVLTTLPYIDVTPEGLGPSGEIAAGWTPEEVQTPNRKRKLIVARIVCPGDEIGVWTPCSDTRSGVRPFRRVAETESVS